MTRTEMNDRIVAKLGTADERGEFYAKWCLDGVEVVINFFQGGRTRVSWQREHDCGYREVECFESIEKLDSLLALTD